MKTINKIDSLAFTAYEKSLIKKIFNEQYSYFIVDELEENDFVIYNKLKKEIEELKTKEISTNLYKKILITYNYLQLIRNNIVNSNLGLIVKLANSFANNQADKDDLIGIGNLLLLDVIDKYNPAKGFKFSTYLYKAIRSKFSKVIKENSKLQTVSLENNYDKPIKNDNLEKYELINLIIKIINDNDVNLNEKELKIIKARYLYNDKRPTLKEVGKIFEPNMHKNYVQVLEKKALNKIHNFLIKKY